MVMHCLPELLSLLELTETLCEHLEVDCARTVEVVLLVDFVDELLHLQR